MSKECSHDVSLSETRSWLSVVKDSEGNGTCSMLLEIAWHIASLYVCEIGTLKKLIIARSFGNPAVHAWNQSEPRPDLLECCKCKWQSDMRAHRRHDLHRRAKEFEAMSLHFPKLVSDLFALCMILTPLDICNINDIRYKLFSKKGLTGDKLPPTLGSLILHLKRANYQCYIWKLACTEILSLPSPIHNGWIEKNGALKLDFMVEKSVPEAISELMRCQCKRGCKNNSCGCRKAKLSCTGACFCEEECENQEIEK